MAVNEVLRELGQPRGLQHVEMPARCRTIGGDRHADAFGHHFHDRRRASGRRVGNVVPVSARMSISSCEMPQQC